VAARLDAVQREQVRAPEVLYVDVVADRGAVRRRVVRAEHGHLRAPAGRGPQHERDQVRLGLVVLALLAGRAGDVEVAQRDRAEPVGAGLVGQHPVHGQLGVPVRVHGCVRRLLGDRDHVRLAVGGAGGGEHEAPHTRLSHRVQQVQGGDDVAAVVHRRLGDGLGHERDGSQVDHAVEAAAQHPLGRLEVQQVHVLEADALGDRGAVAAVERVEHDDLVAAVTKLARDVGADVAGAAGDQDPHGEAA
jgi:hypothetical protein